MAWYGGAAVGKFVHVLFADDDSSGSFQARHDLGVFRGNSIGEHGTGASGLHSSRVEKILQADGNPMKRAAPFAAMNLFLERVCLSESLVPHHGDKGVQPGIEKLDAVETYSGQFDWRNFPGTDLFSGLLKDPVGTLF